MKKSLFFALVCAGALSLCSCGGDEPKNGGGEWTPPVIENPNKIELENAGFENGLEGWTIKNFSNGSKTVVEMLMARVAAKARLRRFSSGRRMASAVWL